MEREDAAGLHNDHSVFRCSENVQNKKQNKPSVVTDFSLPSSMPWSQGILKLLPVQCHFLVLTKLD